MASPKDQWASESLAQDYADSAQDRQKSWYEDEVNVPALLELMPKPAHRLMDFGCGPGAFIKYVSGRFETVTGCDASEAMLAQARRLNPEVMFWQWDGVSSAPRDMGRFDVVVSKLTLEFVSDLAKVARNLRSVTEADGHLLVSVFHPFYALATNPEMDYWEEQTYRTRIGSTPGSQTYLQKIHRSLADYMNAFFGAGYILEQVSEPHITLAQQARQTLRPIDTVYPKRLNLKLRAM